MIFLRKFSACFIIPNNPIYIQEIRFEFPLSNLDFGFLVGESLIDHTNDHDNHSLERKIKPIPTPDLSLLAHSSLDLHISEYITSETTLVNSSRIKFNRSNKI